MAMHVPMFLLRLTEQHDGRHKHKRAQRDQRRAVVGAVFAERARQVWSHEACMQQTPRWHSSHQRPRLGTSFPGLLLLATQGTQPASGRL